MPEPIPNLNLARHISATTARFAQIRKDLDKASKSDPISRCASCSREIPPGKAGRKCQQCRTKSGNCSDVIEILIPPEGNDVSSRPTS